MRTVAVFQSGDQQGHTVFYEIARAVATNTGVVTLEAYSPQQYAQWTTAGIWMPKAKQSVTPSDGALFLDALRSEFDKGGRTFALDSDRGDVIPPSLLAIPDKVSR